MRSVAMIAYGFPPEGSAGVFRPLRFVRHLPTLGWRASVVAADTPCYERFDPGLLSLVPRGTEIVRVRGRDPWRSVQLWRSRRLRNKLAATPVETPDRTRVAPASPLRAWLREAARRAEAWCYHPDLKMTWIRPAVEAVVDLCAREGCDVIWATTGPVSSLVVAMRASERTRIPYVVDFRDAWTITANEFADRRPAWAKRADRRMMYQILAGAQAAVFLYDSVAECYWRAYPGALTAAKVHRIPNGYEGDIHEFEDVPKSETCTVLHAGTLSSYRYDTLLDALSLFKRLAPVRIRQLRLLFVGEVAGTFADEVEARGLSDIVVTRGPTSYAEISRLQQNAHALLVLGRGGDMKGHELFAGAKLFGYLKAGRPIVGVLPRDETRNILSRAGVTTIADSETTADIIAAFQRVLHAWSTGTLAALVPDRAVCAAYSAARQTAALVRALEGTPAIDPFVPGVAEVPPSLREEIGERSRSRGLGVVEPRRQGVLASADS
jgi:hypothetical protein